MKKIYVTFLSLCLMMVALAANAAVRTWDFTKWSDATIANLQAEAAQYGVDGDYPATTLWRSYEKADGSNPQTDKCYWYGTTIEAGVTANMTANGVEIEELKGLYFSPFNGGNLALAVDYPSTSLGEYNGASYLWLGGSTKNGNTMIIPAVKPGSTITINIESHKPAEGRGVGLTINGEAVSPIEGSETPTTLTKCVWVVPTEGIETETVDAVFKNNNGCHIYSITVEEPAAPAAPIFPINEDLTENTGKFINGEIIKGTYVNGMVAKGGNGTASLVFDTDESTEAIEAYAIAENEVVTFSWVSYQGWVGNKNEKVSILNSEGKEVFSYTYNLDKCSITDVQLGGEAAPLFESFYDQGYVGAKSANGWVAKTGQAYLADNANNTVVTVKVYGKGYVEVNFKNEKRAIDNTYASMVPAGFKMDLSSLNLNNVCGNTDRALGINQLSIVSEESTATFMDYTVSRQCDGVEIGTFTATGMVGKEVLLPTAPFYTEDGQKYICLDAMSGILAEDNKEFVIYYEKAAEYTWVLNAVDADGNVLKQLNEGKAFQEDAVTVPYPRYVVLTDEAGALTDSLLYEAGATSSQYNQYITLDMDNKQVNVKYTAKEGVSRVVYYKEAEDMSNYYKKELTTGNAAIRASQGKAVYTTYDASICTLPAGVYKLTVGLFDATSAYGNTFTFNSNRSAIAEFTTASVNLSEQSKEIVLAPESNSLSWVACGNENWGLDYLFIEKVSDEVPYTAAANIAEAKAMANGTPVALTLTNAKVNLSTLHEDFYPAYTLIEDETGAMGLERQFATKLKASDITLTEGKQYTGTLYGSFGVDTNGRPLFYLTGKSTESTLDATDCEVVATEVAIADINTEEGMAANFGKYLNLKDVKFGKVVSEWGGSDFYLISTRTVVNEDSTTTEVNDSIYLYDNYYIFPENIPNFISFASISGFVDKFYDGTITFYPFGEYSAEVKPATRVANIGEVKNIEDGEDIILTLDKAVVTLYALGHSGNLVLLEDATGGVQLQTGDGWFVQEGLADAIGITRDSLQVDGTLYCRVENGGMLILNDSTLEKSTVTVDGTLVPVKPTVVALNKVFDNNYLNRLIQVQKLEMVTVETADPYYPEYVMVEPYFIQGADTVGVYDMFNALEYDENYNPVVLGYLKSVTGIIIEGSEATSWSPAKPNTLAPISYEEVIFKEFTEDMKVALTDENLDAMIAEGWFEGAQTRNSNKKGNIDIETGEEVDAANMPFATVKNGNSAKDVTVYVSGLETVKGFGASTSSSDPRILQITATNVDTNESIVGEAEAGVGVTGVAEVALDKDADYIINFTGFNLDGTGGDVALFGIWFIASNTATGITEVTNNSNAAAFNGDLYNVNGIKVRNAGDSRSGLSKGIYLMKNGKKAVIK
ncbi:MAG: hypothetical protein ACI4BA_07890 [Prevotella sp.]